MRENTNTSKRLTNSTLPLGSTLQARQTFAGSGCFTSGAISNLIKFFDFFGFAFFALDLTAGFFLFVDRFFELDDALVDAFFFVGIVLLYD